MCSYSTDWVWFRFNIIQCQMAGNYGQHTHTHPKWEREGDEGRLHNQSQSFNLFGSFTYPLSNHSHRNDDSDWMTRSLVVHLLVLLIFAVAILLIAQLVILVHTMEFTYGHHDRVHHKYNLLSHNDDDHHHTMSEHTNTHTHTCLNSNRFQLTWMYLR